MLYVLNYAKRNMRFILLSIIVLIMIISIFFVYNIVKNRELSSFQKEATSITESDIKKEIKSSEKTNTNQVDNTIKWRIKIPKLKMDVQIREGTTQPILKVGVGHFENTSKWNGNVGLAGHNRGYKCDFFRDIHKLELDDIIIYLSGKKERKYRVTMNKVIKETNWKYLEDTEDNRITLITCESNKREYRRCIQAIEIK